jgi:hypothetical protein
MFSVQVTNQISGTNGKENIVIVEFGINKNRKVYHR